MTQIHRPVGIIVGALVSIVQRSYTEQPPDAVQGDNSGNTAMGTEALRGNTRPSVERARIGTQRVQTLTQITGRLMGPIAPPAETACGNCGLYAFLAVLVISPIALTGCGGRLRQSNPVPYVTSLAPSSLTAGTPAFTLTVNGAHFIPASTVQWNGSNRHTFYVSATQLTASITANDIATPTYVAVTVQNPGTGGATSTPVGITPLWPEPSHGAQGLLVDAAADLTSLAKLNSFGGPLAAAWNPKTGIANAP
jgi:hypothetical protein